MSDNNSIKPLNEREKRLVRQLLLANLSFRKAHFTVSLDKIADATGLSKARIQQLQIKLIKELAEEGGSK